MAIILFTKVSVIMVYPFATGNTNAVFNINMKIINAAKSDMIDIIQYSAKGLSVEG